MLDYSEKEERKEESRSGVYKCVINTYEASRYRLQVIDKIYNMQIVSGLYESSKQKCFLDS